MGRSFFLLVSKESGTESDPFVEASLSTSGHGMDGHRTRVDIYGLELNRETRVS